MDDSTDDSTSQRVFDASHARVRDTPSSYDVPSRPLFIYDALAFFMSIRPFRGIIRDIKARGPFYVSDWTDAWNYRVVPATALTFFSK
jgi:hypothetical protein